MPLMRATAIRQMDFAVSNGLVYPLTVSGFAIGIKMAKNFYSQQKENERLVKQKINAEVQLLKSQVHPRFLFHSLKSIYNDMLKGLGKSPEMLLKLSDLLSYILYESDEEEVSLEKELALLQNYIELEKSNWGAGLVINIRDNIDTTGKYIAPLLLLPLAETIFEQAIKGTQKQAALTLDIQMIEDNFLFTLMMQGYERPMENSLKENIQFNQVQKRLEALYPGKYKFNTAQDENSTNISLSLLLNEMI